MSGKMKQIIKLNEQHAKVYDSIQFFDFYKKHLQDIRDKIIDDRGKIIVDVGCGTGNFKNLVRNAYYVGVDICKEMLLTAKRKFSNFKNCDFILADAQHLPFKDSSLDVVVSVNVLYQLPEPKKFLRDVSRVIKDDGTIIVSTPYSESSFSGLNRAALYDLLKNPFLILKFLYKLPSLKRGQEINKKMMEYATLLPRSKLEETVSNNGLSIVSVEETYNGQNLLLTLRKRNSF